MLSDNYVLITPLNLVLFSISLSNVIMVILMLENWTEN